jgi:hypothetical protein
VKLPPAELRVSQQVTPEAQEAQQESASGTALERHPADKHRPQENIMTEGVMPSAISLSTKHEWDGIDIRQNRADQAPRAQSTICAADIANGPPEDSVWFKVHFC